MEAAKKVVFLARPRCWYWCYIMDITSLELYKNYKVFIWSLELKRLKNCVKKISFQISGFLRSKISQNFKTF